MKHDDGTTFIEILVSMALLGLSLLGIVKAQLISAQQTHALLQRTIVLNQLVNVAETFHPDYTSGQQLVIRQNIMAVNFEPPFDIQMNVDRYKIEMAWVIPQPYRLSCDTQGCKDQLVLQLSDG